MLENEQNYIPQNPLDQSDWESLINEYGNRSFRYSLAGALIGAALGGVLAKTVEFISFGTLNHELINNSLIYVSLFGGSFGAWAGDILNLAQTSEELAKKGL